MRSPLLALTLLAACATPEAGELEDADLGYDDDGKADRGEALPLSVPEIRTAARYRALAFSDGGLLVLGRSVKFLIDNRNPAKPVVYFMNASYPGGGDAAKYHYNFARSVLGIGMDLETFNSRTYFAERKDFYAGTIQQYRVGAGTIVYGLQLYPQDVAREESLVTAARAVKSAFSIRGSKLALVTTGPQQTTARVGGALDALGVPRYTIDGILADTRYLPMQLGEAWGYLRMFPADDALLAPTDIPVFDELPLDLTVVAGVITRAVQDSSSHVNLKSKERGTPDMVLRDAGPEHATLKAWIGKPVHLVVRSDGFSLTASSDAEVRRKLEERQARPWIPMPVERDTRLLRYEDMCASAAADCLPLARRYGSKATNLGFLTHRRVLGRTGDAGSLSARLGYDLVPAGLGVPMARYQDFVARNPALRAKIDALVADEKAGRLDAAARRARLGEVQQMFLAAPFPAGQLEELRAAVAAVLPAGVTKMKVRSSANAEDIPGFDGAGLYTSFGADLAKTDNADGSCLVKIDADDGDLEVKPGTLACAVKGVYASLWNQRAIEERSFARIDHATAAMGIAIVPKYSWDSDVVANSVLVTRAVNAKGVIGYTMSTQLGNVLVTNPPPGTTSEQIIAAFGSVTETPTFVVTRFATPAAGAAALTKPILDTDQLRLLLEIGTTVETAYCRAKPGYHADCNYVTVDNEKTHSLDLELKLLENGQFVCKQVREFSGK